MPILRIERDDPGLPRPNECTSMLCGDLPPAEFVSAAFVFAFDGPLRVFTHLVKRGLDIPGGHVRPGESPAQAAVRELREETGTRVAGLRVLGWRRNRILAPRPADYPLPYPDSYMVFYAAKVVGFEPVVPDGETMGRALVPPEDARRVPLIQANPALYEAALASALSPPGRPATRG